MNNHNCLIIEKNIEINTENNQLNNLSTNNNNFDNIKEEEMTISENSNIINTVADVIPAQESGTKCSLCSLNVGADVRQHLIQV